MATSESPKEKVYSLKWSSDASTCLESEDFATYTEKELIEAVGNQQVVQVWIVLAIPEVVYSWSATLNKLTLELASGRQDLKRLPELINLVELRLSGSYLKLSQDIFQRLTLLKELYLDNCGFQSLPKSIQELVHLEYLDVSGNDLDQTTEYLGSLRSLKSLKLKGCGLETLPKSLEKLLHLEYLDVSGNGLDQTIEHIGSLRSLKSLKLENCDLETLPKSISQLDSLQELYLSYNDFSSTGLPDVVTDLSELKKLFLSNCQLDVLSTRQSCLTNLERLDLRFNRFGDNGLPEDVFTTFPNITTLKMDECRLTRLPKSIEKLSLLQELTLAGNRFETFPGTRNLTKRLKVLDLSRNKDLRSLSEEMVGVEELTVTDCVLLHTPPYKLFQRGMESVKQYFSQTARNPNRHIPVTVAVLGYSQAGKSSLVKTLQSEDNRRVLTNRKYENEQEVWFDTATKVFNFEEVAMKNNQVLRFIDFGGHEIYHVTYQLTFRDKCIPILVVSMEQFKKMCEEEKMSKSEAVRVLAINWLAQLYTPNSLLPKPILVFTHEDKFKKRDEFDELKAEFLYLMEKMWNEEANAKPNFLEDPKTYSIGKEGKFDDMKSHLLSVAQRLTEGYKPPESWQNVEQIVSQQRKTICKLSQILEDVAEAHQVPVDEARKVLGLMHDCGLLLWYKENASLEQYVFPNITRVTNLMVVLYDHHEKDKWARRIRNFRSLRQSDGLFLNKEIFYKLVADFQRSGIIDGTLFRYLISTESSFEKDEEVDLAFELFYTFQLVYGPIDEKNRPAFLVPNFSRGRVSEFKEREAELRFQLDVRLKGFALPMYRHHQMTVALLNAFPPNGNAIDAKYNGAFIKTETTTIGLIHHQKSKKVSLQVRGVTSAIVTCWSQLRKSSGAIFKPWDKKPPEYECSLYCPHCLLKNAPHPVAEHPRWCSGDEEVVDNSSGLLNASCGDDQEIPKILKTPSSKISSRAMKELQQYVARVLKEREDAKAASPEKAEKGPIDELPTFELKSEAADESESTDEEMEDDLLYPVDDTLYGGIVGLRAAPTRLQKVKKLYNETDEVYEMSAPLRGRALIICNGSKASARQSQIDLENMSALLEDLEFEVVVKRNLTTEAMMTSIKHETQNPHHADYGMFVLVIICCQAPADGVSGTDGRVIDQTAFCRLMSSKNFPFMEKKPKVVLIHNCQDAASSALSQSLSATCDKKMPFSIADTLFVRSEGEATYSWRSQAVGSLFIRCLVMIFYRHASHRNITRLVAMVKQKVEQKCEELDAKFGKSLVRPQVKVCSTIGDRKVYLFPRYDGPRKTWNVSDKLGSP